MQFSDLLSVTICEMTFSLLLDMCRTVVNVTGDTAVATLIATGENKLNVIDENELQTY